MTVNELIAVLKGLPGDTRVVVRGYEGGVNDVNTVEPVFLALDYYEEWYYGEHDESIEQDETHTVPAYELKC